MNVYWGSGISLLFFMGVAWFTGTYLNLEGPMFALFFGMMATLGLTASAAFFWMQGKYDQRKASKEEQAAGAGGSQGGSQEAAGSGEVDVIVRDADNRLAASQLAQGCGISNLPAIFLLGDPG